MGRANRKGNSESGAAGFSFSVGELTSIDRVFPTDASDAGSLLELPDGSRMLLEEDDPAGLLRGLAEVESVRAVSDGTHEILFRNGEIARLSLDSGSIAFASGANPQGLSAAAFSSALAFQNDALGPDQLSSVPETKAMLAQLSDIKSQLNADPHNQDLLRQYARLSEELARGGLIQSEAGPGGEILERPLLPDNITMGDPHLARRMPGEGLSHGEKERREQMAAAVLGGIAEARQSFGADMTMEELLMTGADRGHEFMTHFIPTPEETIERRRAALILSGQMDPQTGAPLGGLTEEDLDRILDPDNFDVREIVRDGIGTIPPSQLQDPENPDAGGRIAITPELLENMNTMRDSMARGDRFFVFRGPPGTGKDTLTEIVANSQGMPLVKIQLGGSNDVNNAKGGFAVVTVTKQEVIYDETKHEDGTWSRKPRLERIPDPSEPDGWAKDEEGKIKTRVMTEEVRCQETRTIEGAMAFAAQYPSMIVIQEPEGQEDDMVQLHGLFGDRVGDTGGRSIMIDSPDGKTVDVHPDCTVVITTNERPHRTSRDGRLPPATIDRTGEVITFWAPEPEEIAPRIEAGVKHMIREQPKLAAYPSLAHDFDQEDFLVFAQIQAEISSARQITDGEVYEVSRSMPRAFADFVQAIDNTHSGTDPVEAVHRCLTKAFPHLKGREQVLAEVETVLGNFTEPLRELENKIRNKGSDRAADSSEVEETVDA